MNKTNWKIVCTSACCLVALCASVLALETAELSLGNDGNYDGEVTITRTIGGEMLLRDVATSPMTLLELAQPASDHGALSGTGGDDHPLYHTAARHASAHGVAYNDALATGADVIGNTTLGDHFGDSRIHLRRESPEQITSVWSFLARPQLYAGALFSAAGVAGDSALSFTATTGTASVAWDDSADEFVVNRGWDISFVGSAFEDGFSMNDSTFMLAPTAGTFDAGDMRAATTRLDLTLGGTSSFEAPAFVAAGYHATRLESGSTGAHSGRAIGLVGTADSSLAVELVGVVATLPEDAPTTAAVGLLAGVEPGEIGSYPIPPGVWAALMKGATLTTGESRADSFALGSGASAQATWTRGLGSPEGAVAAPVGSLYSRLDGGAGTALYVKEGGGSGTTGWAAK